MWEVLLIIRPGEEEMDGWENIIRESELFRDLDERILAEIMKHGRVRQLQEKDLLFMEGFKGDSFYVLLDGGVKVVKTSYDGRESIIKFIQPGEVFAEAVIFGGAEYPASAIAIARSTVFEINRNDFLRLFDDSQLREDFIRSLLRKLFYLASRIHYLSSFDVEERFFRFLLERFGQRESYEITIPKRDIATAIGTVPETLSRLIARLKAQGDITGWDGSVMTLRPGFWHDTDYTR